jgi:hypothetical protein
VCRRSRYIAKYSSAQCLNYRQVGGWLIEGCHGKRLGAIISRPILGGLRHSRESAILKVVDESSGTLGKINAEIKKLIATSKQAKERHRQPQHQRGRRHPLAAWAALLRGLLGR